MIIIGSGRTDSGVHAKSQVANFTLQKKINLQGLKMNLNKLLPNDINLDRAGLRADNVSTNFIPELLLDFKTSSIANETDLDLFNVSFNQFSVLIFNSMSSTVASNPNNMFFE